MAFGQSFGARRGAIQEAIRGKRLETEPRAPRMNEMPRKPRMNVMPRRESLMPRRPAILDAVHPSRVNAMEPGAPHSNNLRSDSHIVKPHMPKLSITPTDY